LEISQSTHCMNPRDLGPVETGRTARTLSDQGLDIHHGHIIGVPAHASN
jgi:hypothetical protein